MILYNSCLIEAFRKTFSQGPREEAIIDGITGSFKTREGFLGEIYRVAQGLQDNGMIPGDTMVIFTRDSTFYAISIFATLLSGGKVAIIDPEMGKENIENKLHILQPRFCIIDGIIFDGLHIPNVSKFVHNIFQNLILDHLSKIEKIIIYGKSFFAGKQYAKITDFSIPSDERIDITCIADDTDAIIVFTGGTTGNPKGIIHSHQSLFLSQEYIRSIVGNESIFYADLPHFLLFGLLMGKIVISGKDSLSSKKILNIFTQYNVEIAFFAPYKIQQFITDRISFPSTFRHLLLGSAPVFRTLLQKILDKRLVSENMHITCLYGMTEIIPIAMIDAKKKINSCQELRDMVGIPLRGIGYQIINDELFIKAPHAMKSYLGKEPLEYIATGDLVDVEGDMLIMKGRKKDMIIRGNYNIYPSLYEGTILRIPGIRDCVLFGVKIGDYDEKIVLMIDGNIYYKKKIYDALYSGEYSIDRFAIPNEIIFGKIPRIGRQRKINRTVLQNLFLSGKLGKLL